jgi:hypothetical protein
MAGSNDFLIFAGAGGANVISQATYAALAALGPGFATGEAYSNQCNKVWRQGSEAAYVLGQLSADVTGNNSTDDGTGASLLQNVMAAMLLADFHADSGAVNAYQVNLSPAISSTIVDGTRIRFRPAHTNTAASTLSVNGSTAAAVLGGNLAPVGPGAITVNASVEVEWNAAQSAWLIIGQAGNVPQAGTTRVVANISSTGVINYQRGSTTISVVHSGTGIYTVTFGAALPSANFVPSVTILQNGGYVANCYTLTTTGLIVETFNSASGSVTDLPFSLVIDY